MATVKTSTSGSIIIGESGEVPIVRGIIGSITPVITFHSKGQRILVAGSGASSDLLPTGMTLMNFIHLRFFDNTTDAALDATVILTDNDAPTALTFEKCHELLYSAAAVANGWTVLTITPQAAGNDTRCEFIIAGV